MNTPRVIDRVDTETWLLDEHAPQKGIRVTFDRQHRSFELRRTETGEHLLLSPDETPRLIALLQRLLGDAV